MDMANLWSFNLDVFFSRWSWRSSEPVIRSIFHESLVLLFGKSEISKRSSSTYRGGRREARHTTRPLDSCEFPSPCQLYAGFIPLCYSSTSTFAAAVLAARARGVGPGIFVARVRIISGRADWLRHCRRPQTLDWRSTCWCLVDAVRWICFERHMICVL